MIEFLNNYNPDDILMDQETLLDDHDDIDALELNFENDGEATKEGWTRRDFELDSIEELFS